MLQEALLPQIQVKGLGHRIKLADVKSWRQLVAQLSVINEWMLLIGQMLSLKKFKMMSQIKIPLQSSCYKWEKKLQAQKLSLFKAVNLFMWYFNTGVCTIFEPIVQLLFAQRSGFIFRCHLVTAPAVMHSKLWLQNNV